MVIGMLGSGRVAKVFARFLLDAGHEVLLSNGHGPDSLRDTVNLLGNGATACSVAEAASAPIVTLAVPWLKVKAVLTNLPAWDGRILIDATNPFVNEHLDVADLGHESSSGYVARHAPGARVVKALNHLYMADFEAGPTTAAGTRVTFVSGDDREAKGTVAALLESFHFAVIDLGSLEIGGRVQQVGSGLAGVNLALIRK